MVFFPVWRGLCTHQYPLFLPRIPLLPSPSLSGTDFSSLGIANSHSQQRFPFFWEVAPGLQGPGIVRWKACVWKRELGRGGHVCADICSNIGAFLRERAIPLHSMCSGENQTPAAPTGPTRHHEASGPAGHNVVLVLSPYSPIMTWNQ